MSVFKERERENTKFFSPSYWVVDSMKTSLFFSYTVSLFLLSHRSSFYVLEKGLEMRKQGEEDKQKRTVSNE